MVDDWQIVVVGAGTMGAGIAQVYASNGYQTTVVDIDAGSLARAEKAIANSTALLVKEQLATSDDAERAKGLIAYATTEQLDRILPQADLVVESVFEDPTVKKDTFAKLNQYCSKYCILCSNTSASNIFDIAEVAHPERMLITHWFNPPFIMDLVEIVCGPKTSPQTVETVVSLHERMGKKPALIRQYVPGFIVNRLATALMREAGYMVSQGWTTPQDIDNAIKATSGVRYAFEGPMALYDIVGWDLIQRVALDLHHSLCNDVEGGNPLGAELVAKGHLGLKSGKGAYDYAGIDPTDYMNARSGKIIKMARAIREMGASSGPVPSD